MGICGSKRINIENVSPPREIYHHELTPRYLPREKINYGIRSITHNQRKNSYEQTNKAGFNFNPHIKPYYDDSRVYNYDMTGTHNYGDSGGTQYNSKYSGYDSGGGDGNSGGGGYDSGGGGCDSGGGDSGGGGCD